jgi:3-hydroxyisobutyrate dehydrogenase
MRIAFIGLGNMGSGMAANQAKAGREVHAYDIAKSALDRSSAAGCKAARTVPEAVEDAEVVISLLPAGKHVRAVYGDDVFPRA